MLLSADLKAPRAHPLISNMTVRERARRRAQVYSWLTGVSPSQAQLLSFFRRRWSKKKIEPWEMFYINYSEYFVFCKRDEHQLCGSKIVPSFRLPFSGADSVMDGVLVSACANNARNYDDLLVLWRTAGMEESKIKFSGRSNAANILLRLAGQIYMFAHQSCCRYGRTYCCLHPGCVKFLVCVACILSQSCPAGNLLLFPLFALLH